jgi:Peptidase family M1 domain
MFDGTIYDRGAMTLQALREKIGDRAFFTVMRTWYADNKYGNVTTPQFIALAERVSRQNLRDFFTQWLAVHAATQPAGPAALSAAGPVTSGPSARAGGADHAAGCPFPSASRTLLENTTTIRGAAGPVVIHSSRCRPE